MADNLYLHKYYLVEEEGYTPGTASVTIDAPVGYTIVSGNASVLVGLRAEVIDALKEGLDDVNLWDGTAFFQTITLPEITDWETGEAYVIGVCAVAVHGHRQTVELEPFPLP